MFKSSTQPLCRYCGKPIPKHTDSTYFGSRDHPEKPKNREEAQRLTNHQITAVRWEKGWIDLDATSVVITAERYIGTVHTWDGESYKDEFFCTTVCSQRLGYLMARNGRCTSRYHLALEKHLEKERA